MDDGKAQAPARWVRGASRSPSPRSLNFTRPLLRMPWCQSVINLPLPLSPHRLSLPQRKTSRHAHSTCTLLYPSRLQTKHGRGQTKGAATRKGHQKRAPQSPHEHGAQALWPPGARSSTSARLLDRQSQPRPCSHGWSGGHGPSRTCGPWSGCRAWCASRGHRGRGQSA